MIKDAKRKRIRNVKDKKKVLASVDELIEEALAGSEDTWNGYHGRQKQVRPKKKLYFKIHEESFD